MRTLVSCLVLILVSMFSLSVPADHASDDKTANRPFIVAEKGPKEVEIVVGTKLAKELAQEVHKFLLSPEGQALIQKHRHALVYGGAQNIANFEADFAKELRAWRKQLIANREIDQTLTRILSEVRSSVLDDKDLAVRIYYSDSIVRSALRQNIDLIAHQLAGDFAVQKTGGGFGTRLVSKAISNASMHAARPRIQARYNAEASQKSQAIQSAATVALEKCMEHLFEFADIPGTAKLVALEKTSAQGPYSEPSYVNIISKNANNEAIVQSQDLPLFDSSAALVKPLLEGAASGSVK